MEGSEPAIGRELAANGCRIREIRYPAELRQASHAHDHDGVTLVLGGGIRETVGRREEVATCLSVVIKPAGVVHADRVGPRGARTLQVLLDPEAPIARNGCDLGPWRWIHAGAVTRALLRLHRTLATRAGPTEVEDYVVEILGELGDEAGPARGHPPSWLGRAREILDDASPAVVAVRDLAAEAGVHPVSLTRAFRRHYGVSVTAYRRRARVRRAAQAIEQTGLDLTRIAHATGFSDHSHMCREIRTTTGVSPSELRRLARAG